MLINIIGYSDCSVLRDIRRNIRQQLRAKNNGNQNKSMGISSTQYLIDTDDLYDTNKILCGIIKDKNNTTNNQQSTYNGYLERSSHYIDTEKRFDNTEKPSKARKLIDIFNNNTNTSAIQSINSNSEQSDGVFSEINTTESDIDNKTEGDSSHSESEQKDNTEDISEQSDSIYNNDLDTGGSSISDQSDDSSHSDIETDNTDTDSSSDSISLGESFTTGSESVDYYSTDTCID